MTTIVTRAGKGSPLTNTEMDTNLTNLNTDKLEAATIATLTNKTIDLTDNTVTGTKAEFDTACSDDNFVFDSEIGSVVQAYDATLTGIAADTTMLGGFRNKIIGGDFTTNPWQRGASFTAPAIGTFTADRWAVTHSSDAVVDVLKTADAPTAAEAGIYSAHCLHADVTTADASIAAGQYYFIMQQIEGLNAACFGFGKSGTRYVTLSFWHKHTKTGTYCVSLRNSADDRSYIAEYTQAVTDTWEKAVLTIPVDTTGTWLYGTGSGVKVGFTLAAGSTYQTTANTWAAGNYFATANQVNALDSTSNNFKIALVQLEAGSVATPFETRSVGQELALCQRYYYKLFPGATTKNLGSSANIGATTATVITRFPVTMRTAPVALEQSGTANQYQLAVSGAGTTCSSVPTYQAQTTADEGITVFTVASGLTAGQAGTARTDATNGANAYLAWSAEL